ncbi:MAG: hypothetical protein COA54_04290 [Thiotrichaceae bacterium]|nr:MAG: hypothetical protein COA54_04290 [Thiotrichaceae bacterium]
MSKLTLEELKKQNPRLYAQCVQDGIEQERKRCVSHLPNHHIKDASARYAIQCVKDGVAMGDLQKANYMAIQMNAHNRERKNAKGSEAVVSMVERNCGVDPNERNGYQ